MSPDHYNFSTASFPYKIVSVDLMYLFFARNKPSNLHVKILFLTQPIYFFHHRKFFCCNLFSFFMDGWIQKFRTTSRKRNQDFVVQILFISRSNPCPYLSVLCRLLIISMTALHLHSTCIMVNHTKITCRRQTSVLNADTVHAETSDI